MWTAFSEPARWNKQAEGRRGAWSEGNGFMKVTTKIALAAAVAGGYLLGRMKKGRLAFAVATYVAGRRFGLDPQQLATEGLKRLSEVPAVAELQEQVRGELMNAGLQALAAPAPSEKVPAEKTPAEKVPAKKTAAKKTAAKKTAAKKTAAKRSSSRADRSASGRRR